MLNIFENDAFSNVETTAAINVVPNKYGRLQQLNVFPDKGVRSRVIGIERKNGVLNLIPSKPVGAPATQGTVGKRVIRDFRIPHFPYEDVILAEGVQGVRKFGTENELMAAMDLVNEKQMVAAEKQYITKEYLRWGALNGIVLDADGSTLYNLFTEFEVTEKVINFALTTGATDVAAKVRELKRYMELNAMGQLYQGIHVMCDPNFFDALIGHAKVEKFYTAFQNKQTLDNDYRNRFEFQGVIFEEHSGQATDLSGNVRKFVPDDTARAFPIGSTDLMGTFNAPADFMDTVNTPGLPLYSSLAPMKHNRGVDMHVQMNTLPLCKRPELLIKLVKS